MSFNVTQSIARNATPPLKNRVGDFFETSPTCVGTFGLQPVDLHWVTYSTSTIIALGVHENTLRHFDPELGRYIRKDPIEEEGGENLYGFVYNHPIYYFDDIGASPLAPLPSAEAYSVMRPPKPSTPRPMGGRPNHEKYWKEWLKTHANLTEEQKAKMHAQLERSCVGITCMNLGILEGDPELNHCYKTYEQAKAVQDAWDKDCICEKKGKASSGQKAKARMFSVKMWYKDDLKMDPTTGHVDMSPWKISNRFKDFRIHFASSYDPPFDFGFRDDETGYFLSGTGYNPGWEFLNQVIYNSRKEWEKEPLLDWAKYRVYCVACDNVRTTPYKK